MFKPNSPAPHREIDAGRPQSGSAPQSVAGHSDAARPMALEQRYMFDAAAVDVAVELPAQLVPTDASADDAGAQPLAIAAALPPEIAANVRDAASRVQNFAKASTAEVFAELFGGAQGGDAANHLARAEAVRQQVADGSLNVRFEVRDNATLQGALGAFAAQGSDGQPTIYLNGDWLRGAPPAFLLETVLIEELGHALDHAINPDSDTAGDEGERFAATINGVSLSASAALRTAAESDSTTLQIDGRSVQVERATVQFTQVFTGTPTSLSEEANELQNLVLVDGSNYSFTSSNPGDVAYSGNNVTGTLSYTDNSTSLTVNIRGVVSRLFKTGSVVEGFYFYAFGPDDIIGSGDGTGDQRETAYLLAIDTLRFTAGTNERTSSDPVDTALNNYLGNYTPPQATNDSSTSTGARPAIEQGGVLNATPGQTATGNVISNDTGSGTPITVVNAGTSSANLSVTASTTSVNGRTVNGVYGTLTIGADGSYSYAPSETLAAVQALRLSTDTLTDRFTYQIEDAQGNTSTATLTITLRGQNDNPVAEDDYNNAKTSLRNDGTEFTAADTIGSKAEGNVLDNDTDVDGNGETKSLTGLAAEATYVSSTAGGSTTSLTFAAATTLNNVSTGYYVYYLDGTVYKILRNNTTPVTVDSNTQLPDGTYDIRLSATPDNAFGASITLSGADLVFDQVSGTPANSFNASQANQGGRKQASVDMANSVQSATITFTLNSGSVAAGMTISNPGIPGGSAVITSFVDNGGGSYTVTIDEALGSSVISGALTLSATVATGAVTEVAGLYGFLRLEDDGSYTYTPRFGALAAGAVGVDDFTYTMVDQQGATSQATLFITVTGSASTDPNATDDANVARETSGINNGTAGVNPSGNVLTGAEIIGAGPNNADTTPSGSNTVTGIRSPSDASFQSVTSAATVTINGLYGSLNIASNGTYTYTVSNGNADVDALNVGGSLTDTFVYRIQNTAGGIDTATLTITINGANDAPVAVADTVEATEDTPATYTAATLVGNDTDVDNPVGSITSVNALTGGTVVLNMDGTITFTPDPDFNGPATFEYTITDANGGTSTAVVTVNVAPVNDAPIAQDNTYSVSVGSLMTGKNIITDNDIVAGADSDIDSASTSFAVAKINGRLFEANGTDAAHLAVNGWMQIALTNGTLFVKADGTTEYSATQAGGDSFTYVLTDGEDISASATVTLVDGALPVTVNSPLVNEGSTHVVFRITGDVGRVLTLGLNDGTANADTDAGPILDGSDDYLNELEYFDATANGGLGGWAPYSTNVSIPTGGVLLVRAPIVNDVLDEGNHTLTLDVTPSGGSVVTGTATINDRGLGDVYDNTGSNDPNAVRDDDRPVTVNSFDVNEGSPYAVFTVSGAAGQLVTLSLNNIDTTGLSGLQYYDPTNINADANGWVNYTAGDRVPLDANGKLFVRTSLTPEQEVDQDSGETFILVATNTGDTDSVGTATIKDDGSGDYFAEDDHDGLPTLPPGAVLDDDRPLTVNSFDVNEGSPYAVFTVSGAAGQLVTLSLNNIDTTGLSGLQYYDPTNINADANGWVNYTAGDRVPLDANGKLFVRTSLTPEQEVDQDNGETFILVATNTGDTDSVGTATIKDDGSGDYFAEDDHDGLPTLPLGAVLDDDRPLSVNSFDVNEGSPYAVFTVSGAAGQLVTLSLNNVDTTGLTGLQYYDPTNINADANGWVNYTAGDRVPLDANGKLFVRTSLTPEQEVDQDNGETFILVATNTGDTDSVGTATIKDDGSGDYFAEDDVDGVPTLPPGAVLDDDRPVTVNSFDVNEGSPYAVFTVSGAAGQLVTLSLNNIDTTGLSGLQYYDPTSINADANGWVNYTAGDRVPLDANGKLFVRTSLTPEQEEGIDNGETFILVATNTGDTDSVGTATVKDDGSGDYFAEDDVDGVPTLPPGAVLDDDRPLTVNSFDVNEGSPYAVFTVSGAAGQLVTLSLNNIDTTGLSGLQYYDPTSINADANGWVNYTAGDRVPLDANGKLFVRTSLTPEQEEGIDNGETFILVATNTGDTDSVGTATVKDDGSGDYFAEDDHDGLPTLPPGAVLDDDRPLTVNSFDVNEGSPYAVFTVSGAAGQLVTLSLNNIDTTGLSGLQYYDPTNINADANGWVNYTAGDRVPLDANGKLFVRTSLTPEQEVDQDNGETFILVATNTGDTDSVGTATIKDDGSGDYFAEDDHDGLPTLPPGAVLDDDRPLTVNSFDVNEGSPYAVFTVSGAAGQLVTLSLNNIDTTGLSGLQYYDPTNINADANGWVNYTAGDRVPLDANGKLFVRTSLTPEQEVDQDNGETFILVATNTGDTDSVGTATIKDDGSGDYFAEDDHDGLPTLPPGAVLDDDRPLTVNSFDVNEGSPYAVFTVSGAAGQLVTLSLNNIDTTGLSGLQYYDPTNINADANGWVNYTAGDRVPLDANGKLFVRTSLTPEQEVDQDNGETFILVATNTGDTDSVGTATIKDDGSGDYFAEDDHDGLPTLPPGAVLDDDRPLTVNSFDVNEGSPYAVFTVSGAAGQLVTLSLNNIDTTGLSGLQYYDPTNINADANGWVNYTAGDRVPLDANGKLFVRTSLTPEQEVDQDNGETFILVATNTGDTDSVGTATIKDDGSGDYFAEDDHDGLPTLPPGAVLDDDRPVAVNSPTVNEGSPFAVFRITGDAGRNLTLQLNNGSATIDANGVPVPDGSEDFGPTLEYLDTTTGRWVPYTGNVTIPAGGVLLVRTPIINDVLDEGNHSFTLSVTPSGGRAITGTATINDLGQGDIYDDNGNNNPAAVRDDDTPRPPPIPVIPPAPVPAPVPAPQLPVLEPAAPQVPVFNSQLQATPLAPVMSVPVQLAPEAPVSLGIAPAQIALPGERFTDSAGFRIAVIEKAPDGLTVYKGITDQFVQVTGTTKIALPYDAFLHSKTDAIISLTSKMANDAPLPAWVRFDPRTGAYTVDAPEGFKGKLDVKVTARDDQGNEATVLFRIFVGEDGQGNKQGQQGSPDKQGKAPQAGNGRAGLSEKLRMGAVRPAQAADVAARAGISADISAAPDAANVKTSDVGARLARLLRG